VNSRLHSRRAAPWPPLSSLSPSILSTSLSYPPSRDEKPVTATPLDSALTNCDACKSFRIRSYASCRVSPAIPCSFSPRQTIHAFASSLFSINCALFGTRENRNPFAFRRFRTLSQKHPGWGTTLPLHIPLSTKEPQRCRVPVDAEDLLLRFFHGSRTTNHVLSGCRTSVRMLRFGIP
jgi:hypothetical protein